jgi:adenylate kinase family enzyme
MMMLERALAVIGPPAAGKTTLTMRLGTMPGCNVFRLREHVPATMLAATATSADRPGWLDDLTVTRALRGYIEAAVCKEALHTVLLDNFPGSDTQARLLLSLLHKLAPVCVLHVVELAADPAVLQHRVQGRRVCHQCERDPIHDPRVPAQASPRDPQRCARCNSILHPRRGDAPRLLAARMRRYADAAVGIRAAFTEAGIEVLPCDVDRPVEQTVAELSLLLATRSTPR